MSTPERLNQIEARVLETPEGVPLPDFGRAKRSLHRESAAGG